MRNLHWLPRICKGGCGGRLRSCSSWRKRWRLSGGIASGTGTCVFKDDIFPVNIKDGCGRGCPRVMCNGKGSWKKVGEKAAAASHEEFLWWRISDSFLWIQEIKVKRWAGGGKIKFLGSKEAATRDKIGKAIYIAKVILFIIECILQCVESRDSNS